MFKAGIVLCCLCHIGLQLPVCFVIWLVGILLSWFQDLFIYILYTYPSLSYLKCSCNILMLYMVLLVCHALKLVYCLHGTATVLCILLSSYFILLCFVHSSARIPRSDSGCFDGFLIHYLCLMKPCLLLLFTKLQLCRYTKINIYTVNSVLLHFTEFPLCEALLDLLQFFQYSILELQT
jgi:hypothetical protein